MTRILPVGALALLVLGGGETGAPGATRLAGAAAPIGGVVTHVRLSGFGTSMQERVPVSLGQVFAVGDVPAGQRLRATIAETGQRVTLQVDRKARHPDGSLRHAVISVILPSLPPGIVRTLVLERGDGEATGPGLTMAGLLATGYDSRVDVTLEGRRYGASARALLQAHPHGTWLDGPLATEWLASAPLTDAEGRSHPHLTARFHVRAYGGYERVLTDITLENAWAFEPGPRNFRYDVSITINGRVRYTRAGLVHLHHARWRQTLWAGEEPHVQVAHDPRYLIATGAVPNYDPALINNITPEHLQFYRDFWRHEDETYVDDGTRFIYDRIGPMGPGLATQAMPDGGAHDDIGPLPRWAAVYLLSQDAAARTATLGMGDLAGSWSIHYRDRKTDMPVSLDDYPYVSTTDNRDDTHNPAAGRYEQTARCPARPANACATPYGEDTAHQPSFAYVPYLVTGDYYYLEELQFWATYNFVSQTPAYRELARGLFYRGEQDRAQAWSLRTLGHAAYITPDNHPLKKYFTSKLSENIDFFHRLYVVGQPNRYGGLTPTYTYPTAAPWMDDFWTWSVGHLVQLGFEKAKPLARWKAQFPVQRMGFGTASPDDYCWIFGAAYHLRIARDADGPMFQTIREVYQGTNGRRDGFDDHGLRCASAALARALGLRLGEMAGYADSPSGYPANMQPALAAAVDSGLPGAAEAWARFQARSVKPDYRDYPVWAVVPRAAHDRVRGR
jgi:hypothetical protein